ncbi:MAG: glycoside hydrolase family 127 protein [Clostridium sp.]|nr:glycoside hydrolase family 127 protein [Clostridium sp.]
MKDRKKNKFGHWSGMCGAGLLGLLFALPVWPRKEGYPISPVPFTAVKADVSGFWGQRLEAARRVTVPLAFAKCEESGRYLNFERAAHPGDYEVKGFSFDDTDVYKTIEGASFLLQTYPDPQMVHYIDSVLDIVAAAQEPDGYLYTARTMNPSHPHGWAGTKRWEKVEELSHEFYNLGHMVEGAVAHYQATGSRKFLDIAIRYADCVCREIGPDEGQLVRVPGHQIAEMALAKLYTVTGDEKYLRQAKFFLDMRGRTDRRDEYSQAHCPVTEQDEAVGHAVRAGYMYSGMADVAALTGDSAYILAIDRIWENITGKKYYITGGVGATSAGEAFGANYELPNLTAYCETCAAIAQVYLNHRLFLLHGKSDYYDCLERTLYNGVLGGMSMDGGRFYYPNPLASEGTHERQPWFGCACCPSNLCRFIPSVPGYVYAVRDRRVYVNLYMAGSVSLQVDGSRVEMDQVTGYPWDGDVMLAVRRAPSKAFALYLRIPGWVRDRVTPGGLYRYADECRPTYTVTVNGQVVKSTLEDGYFCIERKWKKGDRVALHLDMPVRVVKADDRVEADRGRVAVECGPLVYCAEWPDNDFNLHALLMARNPVFRTVEAQGLPLSGIRALVTDAQVLSYGDRGELTVRPVSLKLIPYYAWAHRGKGQMAVWLPQDVSAVEPQ